MQRSVMAIVICGAGALAALNGCASSGPDAAGSEVSLAGPKLPLGPNPAYANFPRYVGTLGGRQIEMMLGRKTDDASGVHGEYHFIGSPARFLVAGDRDGDTLEIEESNDGTHITGNWVGKFSADGSVSGERMNDDDSHPQPFDLRADSTAARTLPPESARPSDSPAAQGPAPARAAGNRSSQNTVGGTSNVIIGD